MRQSWKSGSVWVVLALLSACLCGCRSTKAPGTDSLAAVVITNRTPLEIARAVSEAFQGAGFQPVVLPPSKGYRLMFERQGSFTGGLVYGDWSSKTVWYRAKIKITSEDTNRYLVTCDAFRVLSRGDPHFEEEHKLSFLKRGSYQDLLDQAKTRLDSEHR